ncbi:MAG: Xaa-Pro peptidase family protein [Paracoccaceae bacterium]
MTFPQRGFPDQEFHTRVRNVQKLMENAGLDALFLTMEADVRYFTGFLTRFWESPTRPWSIVMPRSGDPIAVIPSIGTHLMGQCWIKDIRTWRAPDYEDDGLSLMVDTLCEIAPDGGQIGVPSGLETHIRLPRSSIIEIESRIGNRSLRDDAQCVRRVRSIKSNAEIAKIEAACSIAHRAFERVPEIARAGVPLERVFREFQAHCLCEGADWVSYLAGGAGPGGYGDVISPATQTPLNAGDVLMLDTGLVHDGYFCDFDRNWSVGTADPATEAAYEKLLEAADIAFEKTQPGCSVSTLFDVMDDVLSGGAAGVDAGRLGHGLGMQLTEGLSIIPQDHTVLETGMVLTLEPSIEVSPGRTLVHEENIAITSNGARYLSPPAPRSLPVLEL